jgi:hypothetical protein
VSDKDGGKGKGKADHAVVFAFSGFFAPVENLPAFNKVNAGGNVPVKFSLGGDWGLDIFAGNHPKSKQIDCDSGAALNQGEETAGPGNGELTYSQGNDRYTFNWKTKKGWAGTCRQLILKFIDGTFQYANFKFK